jgi:hypothetical protein
MRILNSFLSGTFDVLLYPFQDLPPIVGLTVMSVITAIAMLLFFKKTSDQQGLAVAKRQMHAGVFEIRLFSDDPRAILSAQLDILRHSFRYMRLTLVPMLWMIIPLLLVIVQLQYRYRYGGLEVGREAIVKVKLRPTGASAPVSRGLTGSRFGWATRSWTRPCGCRTRWSGVPSFGHRAGCSARHSTPSKRRFRMVPSSRSPSATLKST